MFSFPFQLIEKIFITFPDDGPRIFSDLLPVIYKNVIEGDVCSDCCLLYSYIKAKIPLGRNANMMTNATDE